MASKSPVYCPVCNEKLAPNDDLEQHLVHKHKPRELARRLVSEWESDELGDPM